MDLKCSSPDAKSDLASTGSVTFHKSSGAVEVARLFETISSCLNGETAMEDAMYCTQSTALPASPPCGFESSTCASPDNPGFAASITSGGSASSQKASFNEPVDVAANVISRGLGDPKDDLRKRLFSPKKSSSTSRVNHILESRRMEAQHRNISPVDSPKGTLRYLHNSDPSGANVSADEDKTASSSMRHWKRLSPGPVLMFPPVFPDGQAATVWSTEPGLSRCSRSRPHSAPTASRNITAKASGDKTLFQGDSTATPVAQYLSSKKVRPGQPFTRLASGSSLRHAIVSNDFRTSSIVARELSRIYCSMRREPVPGVAQGGALCHHPAKEELDAMLPRGLSGGWRPQANPNAEGLWNHSLFHAGKRDGFDFWRDLKMPFHVTSVQLRGPGAPEGELFDVEYYCALSYCADHLCGMARDGMTFENRIQGVAQLFIPFKLGSKQIELVSWGHPRLVQEAQNVWVSPETGLGTPTMVLAANVH